MDQGEASIYDLKYSNLITVMEELESAKFDEDEFSEDSGIEMTPEEYYETTNKVIMKIALKTNNNPDVYFDKAVYSEGLYSIIDLKSFLAILTEKLEIELNDIEIYCIFNRFKFDQDNPEDENMDYKKMKIDMIGTSHTEEIINKIKSYLIQHSIGLEDFLRSIGDSPHLFQKYLIDKGMLKDNETLGDTAILKEDTIDVDYLRSQFMDFNTPKVKEVSPEIDEDEEKYNFDDVYSENEAKESARFTRLLLLN
jgi:hypothetical protein